ncbi:MAG TPA: ABC transporter ATP-binding protein [Acidimicrobiales bacterium]|nr:ABC transporter ATP-binding protein [Acidimicrobiales bacterium]
MTQPLGAEAGGWLRRMSPLWWAHRRVVIIALVASVVSSATLAVTPWLQKIVIDSAILHHTYHLEPLLLLMAGVFALQFVFSGIRRFSAGRVSWDIDYDLRNTVFGHLQGLDFARHDQLQTGQLVSRTNSDLVLIRTLLTQLPLMLANVLQFLLAVVIMAHLSLLLTAIVVPLMPLLFFLAFRMRRVVYPSSWEMQARMAEMVGAVDDSVSGVRVVKGFGQEERELGKVTGALGVLYGSRLRNWRLRSRRTSTLQTIPQLGQVAVLALGGWLVFDGKVTVGTLVAFFSYLTQLTSPARQMAGVLVVAQQARAGAERVLELLDSLPDVVEKPDAIRLPELEGGISFNDVSFGYLRSEPVLDGFDLQVRAGETVALVGTSGSGKSTVGLLLPRFYDVQRGSVQVDGIDVRDVTFDSLRRQIGVVFEDSFLFSDTVKANIAYGRPGATEAQVEAAARAAEAHRFVMELPDGYDTVVGERGLLLSGGQRQRITLARALITNPRILLLDDATSSIDSRIEEEIHSTLRRLMVGRTTILIAHRRSTLHLADRIVVLDQGRVVDSGTHEELLDRSPLYRDLLAGPGEDAEGEGVDLGTDATEGVLAPEVTATAWAIDDADAPGVFQTPTALGSSTNGVAGTGGGMGGGMGRGGGGMRAGLSAPPTPELMAAIEALPPVVDEPDPRLALESSRLRQPFKFAAFLRPFLPQLSVGVILVVLDAAAGLVGPSFTGTSVDSVLLHHEEHVLWLLSGLFFVVTMLDWADMWAETFWTGRTSERMLFSMRVRIFAHLQRLGMDFYDHEMTGRILTRMTSDVDTLSQLLQSGLLNALVYVVQFVGVIAILASRNTHLILLVLTVVPPLALATVWFRIQSRRAYDRQRDRISAVNADLQENISGVRVTQAFRREGHNNQTFLGLTAGYRDAGLRSLKVSSIYFSFATFVGNIAIIIVLGVGSHEITTGTLSVGSLTAFLLYLTLLFAPVQQLSQVFDTYQQATAGLRKISGVLNTPIDTPVKDDAIVPGRLSGRIRFSGVRFRYTGTTNEALSGVDFEVAPGETVALVGETGAGKSTIVKLVSRFYDPTEGQVAVDGLELRDLDLGAYRRQLGYVPQEPFLFRGTIRDNIAYGRPDATDAEVEAAARAVGAHDFIVGAGGYRKGVSERGRSLSIGQRQLLCLARAQLVNPSILLLDEATSNLDLSTEAKVNRAMGVVSSGRTTILIAHRLQTARRADRILVLDGGRVVETGSHDALVADGGRYASMWRAFDVQPEVV